MLDTDTKRRIDTARDILVGKVPDPKSQVEQITIALIYKFMDDMDAEAEELGGKRKFFADGFARYGWAKLMRSGLGGHETLNLYAEAIAKMPENPGIPLLFRDIFKNAYLPYRDPETLRAFLKIIDEFSYDHSERLGDAFEYLLSVLGSQGDAGQFRTPRHIIDFIVAIIDPKKNETVLDPACGTAGFLISSYKHILRANTDAKGHSTLTPDEKGRLAKNFKGYDISPDMVRLSLVNMYLHGFSDPHIFEYDALTSQDRWNENADVILANPPFMSPKGGIKPHRRFSVQSKRSEVLFVDYMAEHLTPAGRAGIIVPEGIIFQSQTAYKQLRQMLVENYLVAVVSLPAGVFNPYSAVKTSVLILDKSLAKQTNTIAFSKIDNEGFGLGAQRREIDKNDLPQARAEIAEYLRRLRVRESMEDYQPALSLIVAKEKIAANGDYNLNGERYRENGTRSHIFPLKELQEIADKITDGTHRTPTYTESGIPFLRVTDITESNSAKKFISKGEHAELIKRCRPEKGDVLYSKNGTIGVAKLVDWDWEFSIFVSLALIKPKHELVIPRFLEYLLNSKAAYSQAAARSKSGTVTNLHLVDIKTIQIPLPPLEVQKEIVAKIESYQRVIDGARAVLENYRPDIPVQPDWATAKLADLCTLVSGQHIDRKDYNTERLGIGYLTGPADFGSKHPTVSKWTSHPKVFAEQGDILITVKGSGLGKINLLDLDKVAISRQLMAIRVRKALPEFVYAILRGKYGYIQSLGGGAAIPGITRDDVLQLKIPLPPVTTQQQIVSEIEAEQALVDANGELIERFDKKIRATLARVWGEEEAQ
jgi:type I restriction enzyme M protein